MTDVLISEHAADWLRDAENETSERIRNKLHDIEDFPEHYLKRLSDSPYYRLRVGKYRVIVDWDRNDEEILVREIKHREGAYD
jgi:mRNA interferase RelE/StbE